VLITADQHKAEEYADMNTIVTLVALQGVNPSIYSIVELLTKKHIQNAQNLGVNEMIKTNELISQVMYEHIFVKKLESLKKE
jgi:voltage-gated potassium channel